MCVLIALSCLILWDPMDCSPPGSSVYVILQAKILEWVAISFSRVSSWPRNRNQVSHIAGRFFTIWATKETLRILEWVAIPFFRGSSWPRDQTWVSHIADRFFTIWATREGLGKLIKVLGIKSHYLMTQNKNKNWHLAILLATLCQVLC